ncbi:uncharacterized protein LOC124451452 [Xenia sp. Carnegie-2017]|uniref:uncharacterized protein LOC124451452 n=1 Tax=Xenia sp. Carnegie-2017 TaxID=2897299 RepID=UPI001F03E3CA|nr:uncharacterized protein LOC124451452 [Xenia sp. Carnegie-2017]
MGDCEYVFAKDCSKDKLFEVRTKNVICGKSATCTEYVSIIIAGNSILMTRQRGTAVVNRVRLSKFPIIRPGFEITNPSRSSLIVKTHIGVSVSWNFWMNVKVTVSGKYKGKFSTHLYVATTMVIKMTTFTTVENVLHHQQYVFLIPKRKQR